MNCYILQCFVIFFFVKLTFQHMTTLIKFKYQYLMTDFNFFDDNFFHFYDPLYKFKIMVYRNFIYPLIIFRETDLLACDHPNQMAFGLGSNCTNRPYWIGRKTKGTTYEPPNRSVMCCLSIRSERPRFVESVDISANIIKRLLEL